MIEVPIPINADVSCTNGYCGKSSHLLLNPITQKLTHIVVQGKEFFDSNKRLVPFDRIIETTPDLIRLNCTKEELAKMEAFTETHYIKRELPPDYPEYYPELFWPYAMPMPETEYIPVEDEHIPPGEVAVHRGAQVEATDGHVGQVDEFLVDPVSGYFTHLVLQKGHLWGKKELTLPMSAIERIFEDTVYLKLDKKAIELLPTIPVKRFYN